MADKESHVPAGKRRQPSNLLSISAVPRLKVAETGLKKIFFSL
jgi:hypothetical protein